MTTAIVARLKVDQLHVQDEHGVQYVIIKLFNATTWATPGFFGEQDDLWLKGQE